MSMRIRPSEQIEIVKTAETEVVGDDAKGG